MTICQQCKINPVYILPNDKPLKLCATCTFEKMMQIPNPGCLICGGTGEYYTHSEDCTDDLCALAGGYHDCAGQVVECDCSIFDED